MFCFDYDLFARKQKEIETRIEAFVDKDQDFLPVVQWSLGEEAYGYNCRYPERMLASQLEAIERTLEADSDWICFLEPWHGVGIYAEAFGCPFEWRDNCAPWTSPIVKDIKQLQEITKPSLEECKMLQMVLETTEYFNEQTGGIIPISTTDTQSPLDTALLICDTNFFFTESKDYPESFHRLLSNITEVIIEFTKKQRCLCNKPASPGHSLWSPSFINGISISEDILALIGPEFYREFAKPYNERIASELGGVCIHSCGVWKHNFSIVEKTEGITMADLAISEAFDPNPNDIESVIHGFTNTDCIIQVRCDGTDLSFLKSLKESPLKFVLCLPWDNDSGVRQTMYSKVKHLYDQIEVTR